MSDLDRMTGLKHLRVRGMPQVRVAAVLKATGLNILRAVAFKNRLRRQKNAKMGSDASENRLFATVKALLLRVYGNFQVTALNVANDCRQLGSLTPALW